MVIVITTGFTVDKGDIVDQALKNMFGVDIAIYTLSTDDNNISIKMQLYPLLKKAHQYVILTEYNADGALTVRLSAMAALITGVMPITVLLHAEWDQDKEAFYLPAWCKELGIGILTVEGE